MPNETRKRTGVACFKDGQLLAVELQDPATGAKFWSLPGGEIESGETPEEAAVRETLEETGYKVTLNPGGFTSQYLFQWNGALVPCETHWFTAICSDAPPQKVEDASYLLQASWLTWPDSKECFAHHPAIAEAVERLAQMHFRANIRS